MRMNLHCNSSLTGSACKPTSEADNDNEQFIEADSRPETEEKHSSGSNMAASNLPHVINLSNSIIGVTILAMPFCFKQCGILLGAVLLFFCTWLTLVSCRLLMKAGVTSRRRSYGFLAYYTYGAPGKLAVEIGMIGLQLGTLIAQVVIIGDLGPAIVSKYLGLENNGNLRMGLICFLCLCVGLPLGLLKNLNTVSRASTLCILFYGFFTVYVFTLSIPNLISGDWIDKVNLWRTDGLFKCLPIFSFAFGCQTQLFIMYDNLPEPSLKSVNNIVQSAVNMCTVSYLLTGFFGYIAFHDVDIGGDIVTDFQVSLLSDVLKLGFVISIAVTFPLIIFPCRGSLYTLLFPQKQKHNDDLEKRPVIPELHFKVLTTFIVVGSMTTGILVPNVEFVLAMNGATMGTLICYIFPAVFFLRVMTSSSDGKQIAQAVLIFGCLIMVLCTLTTLKSQEQGQAVDIVVKDETEDKGVPIISDKEKPLQPPVNINTQDKHILKDKPPDKMADDGKVDDILDKDEKLKDKRVEPPNPRAPSENDNLDKQDVQKPRIDSELNNKKDSDKVDKKKNEKEIKKDEQELGGQDQLQKVPVVEKELGAEQGKDIGQGKDTVLGQEVRQEGDKENTEDRREKEKAEERKNKKQDEIINELEKQREEQRELIEEQKEILAQLKEHEQEHKQIDAEKQQAINGGQPGQQLNLKQGNGGQPIGGVQQQQGINQPVGGVKQQQNINQPVGGQQVINQPIGGVQQQQQGGQPIGGVQQQQQGGQPIGGVQQQQQGGQPIGGVQQQQQGGQPIGRVQQQMNMNQPVGKIQQQQGVNQPIGGIQQQQVGNQPIGGVQQQQQQGINQPIGGVQQQQGINQPIRGVQQQQGINQPIGGVQQQQGINQPIRGVQQQQGINQPIGGVQQQQGINQPIRGVQQQAGAGQNTGNIKEKTGGQIAGNFQQQVPEKVNLKQQVVDNAVNTLDKMDNKHLPQAQLPDQNNIRNVDNPNKELDLHIKKKSSKKHKKEHKEEVRRRRDVADDVDPHKDKLDDEKMRKPKPPNEEMRRKKLSVNENQDLDIKDIIKNLDSMNDLSLVHGRSLKAVLRKRS
ncbi:putative sodium-coupled neutral amino acid transporter 10 [Ylistrum balloti]|uniref:putative sodium-coupled neutral amino acid transporter 10 n=1 Tax=Ylistrum balloti TaxID=509963 RepID=UPI002905CEB9|nr:putative sodium-coupled neutral amino acid transporter 10 [Ylistrum balloti]